MKILKFNMILVWLFLIATQFVPALASMSDWALIALIILPIAHTLEFFAYLPLLKQTPGSMQKHFVQVFIHGVIYYLEVKQLAKQGQAAQ